MNRAHKNEATSNGVNRIEVIALDAHVKHFVPRVRRFTNRLFSLLRVKNSAIEIYLVHDRVMKKNVLSYEAPKKFPRPDIPKRIRSLGEVYLNPSYIGRAGCDFSHMLVHGVLHLCGYCHGNKRDRMKMEAVERRLLRRMKAYHI